MLHKVLAYCALAAAAGLATAAAPITPEPWNRTIPVPFTEQPNDYTCGPTSLSMLLGWAGVSVSVDDICAVIGGCPSDGIGESTVLQAAV